MHPQLQGCWHLTCQLAPPLCSMHRSSVAENEVSVDLRCRESRSLPWSTGLLKFQKPLCVWICQFLDWQEWVGPPDLRSSSGCNAVLTWLWQAKPSSGLCFLCLLYGRLHAQSGWQRADMVTGSEAFMDLSFSHRRLFLSWPARLGLEEWWHMTTGW